MIGYHLQNALRGIRRSPVTSLVIIMSIALGIAVSVTMIAFYNGMQVEPVPHKNTRIHRVLLDNWQAEKPFAEPDLAPPALTLQDVANLRRSELPATDAALYHGATHLTLEQDGLKQRVKASTRATTRGFFSLFEPPFLYGGSWDEAAETSLERVTVISRAINDRLFGGIDSTGREIEIDGTPFRIVGVLDRWEMYPLYYDMTREDLVSDEVFVPFDVAVDSMQLWPSFSASPQEQSGKDFDTRYKSGEAVFVQYWVELAGDEQRAGYQQFLDGYIADQKRLGRFPRAAAKAELYDIPHWIDRQQENGNQRIFVQTLVVVSLLFFGICLLNIVTLLIARFMGNAGAVSLLRALGVPRSAVFVEHLLEAGILGVVGGALGLLLARVGVTLLGPLFMGADEGGTGASVNADAASFGVLLDSGVLLLGIGIAVLGALLVALYPTWKVCRIAPTAYLKSL